MLNNIIKLAPEFNYTVNLEGVRLLDKSQVLITIEHNETDQLLFNASCTSEPPNYKSENTLVTSISEIKQIHFDH